MDTRPDDPIADSDVRDETEGGPVKTFLEHLEDLRWVLIKSLAALALGFIVCLLASNWIIRILTYPLKITPYSPPNTQQVQIYFGSNKLGTIAIDPNDLALWGIPTNQSLTLRVAPIPTDSNRIILGLTHEIATHPPGDNPPVELVTLGPAASFILAFKMALYGGAVLAAPFILYFICEFVFPALKPIEKKYVTRGLVTGVGMFLVGVLFCYFVMIPVSLRASILFSRWLGLAVYQWRAEEYVSFVIQFMLGMGLGFQVPVILIVLVKLRVLDYKLLARARPYVILINLTLSAILTPPDLVSQIMMAIPLQLMYELTVLLAWFFTRKSKFTQQIQ